MLCQISSNACIIVYTVHLQLPTAIADNAGYDSSELIANLRAAHAKGNNTAGLGEHWIEICVPVHLMYELVVVVQMQDASYIVLDTEDHKLYAGYRPFAT